MPVGVAGNVIWSGTSHGGGFDCRLRPFVAAAPAVFPQYVQRQLTHDHTVLHVLYIGVREAIVVSNRWLYATMTRPQDLVLDITGTAFDFANAEREPRRPTCLEEHRPGLVGRRTGHPETPEQAPGEAHRAESDAGCSGGPRGLGCFTLTWVPPTMYGASRITGYKVEVSEDGTDGSWTELEDDTESADPAFTVTGLPGRTTRHYRVSAVNASGAGDPSEPVSNTTNATVPGKPTGLLIGAVSKPCGAEPPRHGFRCELVRAGRQWRFGHHRLQGRGLGERHRLDAGGRGHDPGPRLVTGLLPGSTRYSTGSRAINAQGESAPSDPESDTTRKTTPLPPRNLDLLSDVRRRARCADLDAAGARRRQPDHQAPVPSEGGHGELRPVAGHPEQRRRRGQGAISLTNDLRVPGAGG